VGDEYGALVARDLPSRIMPAIDSAGMKSIGAKEATS